MEHTILIIDDNTELRENTAELLDLAGYKTHTARNGKEGLELARKVQPDLILCDIMMPELDGYGVLRAVNNIASLNQVPFVFLTAKSEKEDFRAGMDLGADDYLTKPFNGDDLLRVVEARLKKSRMMRKQFGNTVDGLNEFMNDIGTLDEIKGLSVNRVVKKYKTREYVFMEGDTPNTLYFLASGKVKIYKTNEDGKEYITNLHNAGEFFGYQAMLRNGNHQHSAMTMEDTELMMIPKNDFFNLLFSSNEVALKFIRYISSNAGESEEKLLNLAYNSARKRVAEALLFMYKKYNEGGKKGDAFPAQRENISALAGISPESVSRNITDLREEGLISTDNGEIRITDLARLEKLRN
ncbi:MAG: Crp/Fnr family transcriptional regulator [Bacteroidetes bacterium]|nr:MAG: Crp/Fnr family transcriptional regulator [Bacteroidota bacterium]